MNYAPQVETSEISDAGLDSVSGGLAAGVAGGGLLQAGSAELCADVFAAASAEGVVASVGVHASAH
ncbi:hypothetical protein G5C60_38900 [Streptomyces sp. HC44]|uniref:Type A2 lantipeptide n=1 Tax=Streptomyces scabichelini TaxID=2711217 RepID=A0A6G4VH35_9ACTN|nr:hypothetical protein [Streptomyces scabichelini]NGO13409.1 hypothetical protein [Streptomyces scabichelini]